MEIRACLYVPLDISVEAIRTYSRVGAFTRDRQAHIYQGGAQGSTDQSEASILYPPEYLGRMLHVRGVVWGHPYSNTCFFFPH